MEPRDRLSSDEAQEELDASAPILHNSSSHLRFFSKWTHLLLPVFLPFLLLLLLALSFSYLRPLHQITAMPARSPPAYTDSMRESELRALRLLQSQQSALLHLFARTSGSNSTHLNQKSFSQIARSRIRESIELSKQIERELGSRSNSTLISPDFDSEICRKVDRLEGKRILEWNPTKGRYLLAICVSGSMSNRLVCLRKHILFAAVLDRVLVFPSGRFDYRYDKVIDIDGINGFVGRKVVLSFDEFAKMKRRRMRVGKFVCYMANPPCLLDDGRIRKLKGLGLSLPKLEVAWPDDAKLNVRKKRSMDEIKSKFATKDEVLAVGDLFDADFQDQWVIRPGREVSSRREGLFQPSQLVKLTAERFVQTFLGKKFVALHFPRRDFLTLCNAKEESCFFPIPQAAECIVQVVEKANPQVIYLSTDASESQITLLQSLISLDNKILPLIRRPKRSYSEKWDILSYRRRLGGDDQVEAMLDRTICAMSTVFIGSSGSAFTEDIIHIREDWGLASTCDEYLCEGQRPNFVATRE